MVTTVVTTTTVTTVTSLVGAALGVVAVLTLIVLLIAKELGSAEEESGRKSRRLAFFLKAVNVPIVPLLAVFAAIVAAKVLEVL
jgi:ABC-type transport system involved in multi-copper enzyme maturation permease subunit